MATESVAAPRRRSRAQSVIQVIANIKLNSYLKPNGRVFAKLAKGIPRFMMDGDELTEMTHEERFMVRFRRWLDEPLQHDFDDVVKAMRDMPTFTVRAKAFMLKLAEYERANPPPWKEFQS